MADHDVTLVIGGTGVQGGAVARALVDAGHEVRAATRDPASAQVPDGATPVAVDLRDPASIATAAEGVDGAFFHLPMALGGPDGAQVEQAAIAALRDAGVDHLVYNTGFAIPDEPVGQPALDGRVALVGQLVDAGATVLIPTGYMENLAAPWSAPLVLDGELRYPLPPDAVNAWVTNDDVGAATAAALARPEVAKGRRYRLAGPEALEMTEVAERLGRALDRTVRYRQVSGAEYGRMLAPHLGEQLGAMVGAGYDRMPPGPNPLLTPDTTAAREELGVAFTPLEDWARRQDWEAAAG